MKHRPAYRRRCIECRKWFRPAASAEDSQRVCGLECRRHRDNALASARRWRDPDRYREDERLRQRKCRAARSGGACAHTEGPGVPRCHAPPSDANPAEFQGKVLETWDRLAAMSRATLEQELARFLGGDQRSAGTRRPAEPPCHAPP